MADNTLTEDDGDELIPVETPPQDEEEEQQQQAAPVEDDDDDEDDERLAQSEDDTDDEVTRQAAHDKRSKRRERQKRARDAAQRELQMLRETVAALSQRVAATETHAVNTNVQSLEARLARAQAEVRQAEAIMAKAAEAGNGEDMVAAMKIRDQAMSEAQQLYAARQQFEEARQQPTNPAAHPAAINYAQEWMQANPWYDPNGRDRDSALTKAIDNELASEGYDPTTRAYWEELTARVADAIGGDDDAPAAPAQSQRRKGPPTGNTRQHAPVSTKKEIYVTPERKAAMIEAGVWDDPVMRQRYLKAYQAYDTGSAR